MDADELPLIADSVAFVKGLKKPTVADVLRSAQAQGLVAIQPRCGVGGHEQMRALLLALEEGARPDILSLTIDSYTRLNQFDMALSALCNAPEELNGYPLVTHGWRRGRDLNQAISVPLEVRHGSPLPRRLFETAVASGITSFEGGGISYNLPYCKDVPLVDSLNAYAEIDARCGELAQAGVVVDRELFGSLTGVLVPPSVSLAISVLEAVMAAHAGVACISIAYPQSGNMVQDVAALRAIRSLAVRYLPPSVDVYPVLHEFMGVFPKSRARAEQLIFAGALTARLGGAAKVVTKTIQEGYGIPDASANIHGMRLARVANAPFIHSIRLDESALDEEQYWIEREVDEIVGPLLEAIDLPLAISSAFEDGSLDVPFSASRHARSSVMPCRDRAGAVRYLDAGGLPFSEDVRRRNRSLLEDRWLTADDHERMQLLMADINYFLEPPGEQEFDFVPAVVESATQGSDPEETYVA
ncbi:methylaspartate mutase [Micromonospora peucetia]|uniref:Glutamate mutase subunit E n=1 Tax=Micromonospora peucetia TaxID=47871 RepID=A0A1C6UZR3_9ACTN|nr:methylaspartate mutase [Micromonospora peucetia]WSA35115.1 methylaspartate mutase [Micromonospora peucetia]SCL59499.1 Glutamate mutase subunit E [Micromonospora peucetia]